jgi:hypothetical protein
LFCCRGALKLGIEVQQLFKPYYQCVLKEKFLLGFWLGFESKNNLSDEEMAENLAWLWKNYQIKFYESDELG